MAWTWRFEKADGTEVPPAVQPEEFTTQGDAESWVGEVWQELLEGGADQVTLLEGDDKVYGPMSLHAEEDAAPAADGARRRRRPDRVLRASRTVLRGHPSARPWRAPRVTSTVLVPPSRT